MLGSFTCEPLSASKGRIREGESEGWKAVMQPTATIVCAIGNRIFENGSTRANRKLFKPLLGMNTYLHGIKVFLMLLQQILKKCFQNWTIRMWNLFGAAVIWGGIKKIQVCLQIALSSPQNYSCRRYVQQGAQKYIEKKFAFRSKS